MGRLNTDTPTSPEAVESLVSASPGVSRPNQRLVPWQFGAECVEPLGLVAAVFLLFCLLAGSFVCFFPYCSPLGGFVILETRS